MFTLLMRAAAQFGAPGVGQLHQALNAAMAEYGAGYQLARNVSATFNLGTPDQRLLSSFDAMAPLCDHCENCDTSR